MDARQLRSRREDPAMLARLLSGALLINPDVTTFWNMRRELLQAGRLDMQGELHFIAVLLSRKPKCTEAFAHRKWVVRRLLLAGADKDALLEEELQVSRYAADRYPNNYHAWSHRMWCLANLAPATSAILHKEWAASEAWVSSHVSDHSGMQYRQFLLDRLLELKHSVSEDIVDTGRKSIQQLLSHSQNEDNVDFVQSALIKSVGLIASELLLNTDLILRFAGHEALWCHRRYLLVSFKKILNCRTDMNGTGGCRYSSSICVTRSRCAEKLSEAVSSGHVNTENAPLERDQKLSSQELGALDRDLCHLQGAMMWHEAKLISGCQPDELHQQRLAKQHRKWLSHVLKLDVPAVA
ncbi:protein prenyltransferase alpha subunit repeat-containing protein 1 isoform X2 [Zootermopsis nevadensis]|nr:protein prenyltransferase alpha subunit repeat-containing protein 1 isoform X2 [Zootermopsis nevadensis]